MSSRKEALPLKNTSPIGPQGHLFAPDRKTEHTTGIWYLILIIRIINGLCVATFFQPDEYFQSLEPAWQMAFGNQSGAWITWVGILNEHFES
jgi:GPI mannosyltransferase 3